jgi:hypothetical protein
MIYTVMEAWKSVLCGFSSRGCSDTSCFQLLVYSNCTQSTIIAAELVLLGTHAVSLALARAVTARSTGAGRSWQDLPSSQKWREGWGLGSFFLVVQFPAGPATEHTDWQWPLDGVHSIMMVKSAQDGEAGMCTPNTFHSVYHHKQSCVYAPAYTLPLFLLYTYMYSVGPAHGRIKCKLSIPLFRPFSVFSYCFAPVLLLSNACKKDCSCISVWRHSFTQAANSKQQTKYAGSW